VEVTVRRLHELATAAQDTYEVVVPLGDQRVTQRVPLRGGDYKEHPNHVREADGTVFAYAPVDRVSDEMHRLVTELSTPEFAQSHPVIQAAYAHYCFVRIHPFADGNGRVSRALASVFLLRAASVPLVIYADQKGEYLDALKSVDHGTRDALVGFVFDRTLDAIGWAADALDVVPRPTTDGDEWATDSAMRTRTAAALRLHGIVEADVMTWIEEYAPASVEVWETLPRARVERLGDGRRSSPEVVGLHVGLRSKYLDQAYGGTFVVVSNPRNAKFTLGVVWRGAGQSIDVRESDIYPELKDSLVDRVNVFVRRCLSHVVEEFDQAMNRQLP
jgi:fido (protein-threonine AMPylation protein)